MTYSPDGRLLLVGNWRQCRLWDSVTGEIHSELLVGVAWGAFSPNGKQLVFAHYPQDEDKEPPTAIIWDIAAGKEVRKLEHPRKERFCFQKLAFAPDSLYLLTL